MLLELLGGLVLASHEVDGCELEGDLFLVQDYTYTLGAGGDADGV